MTGSFCGVDDVAEATGEISLIGADSVAVAATAADAVMMVSLAGFFTLVGDLTGDDGADVAGEDDALVFFLGTTGALALEAFNMSV